MYTIQKNQIKKIFPDLSFLDEPAVTLPFNNKWKSIGVSVSGGADSALLAYLLSKHIYYYQLPIKINFISNIRMWETRPWQRYDSIRIFNTIKSLFPSLTYKRYENFVAPEIETGTIGKIIPNSKGDLKGGDQISTFSFANYICRLEKIDAWYAGITKNPPIDFNGAPDDRNNDFEGSIKEIVTNHKDLFIIHPFKFESKDKLINLYKKLDLLDLLSKTRSCEGDTTSAPEIFNGLDFDTYIPDQFVPVCGKCFWCKEREWAMKKNNL